ncbi:MAG: DUF4384 domain-containing protein [Gammaproteobacteria bacterium]|nr:DUF4384 domain-containing protein [Gammaproteobacteria bacterium]
MIQNRRFGMSDIEGLAVLNISRCRYAERRHEATEFRLQQEKIIMSVTQRVLFPAVKGPGQGRLLRVAVFPRGDGHRHLLRCGPKAKPREMEIEKLLSGVRFQEKEQVSERPVSVNFEGNGEVTGASYTLALAVADRSARFCANLAKLPPLIATGVVDANDLSIRCVDDFPEKLRLIRDALGRGEVKRESLFLYPAANGENAEDAKKLAELKKSGLQLRPLRHLDDIGELWGRQNSGLTKKTGSGFWTLIITLLLFAGVWLVFTLFDNRPSADIPKPLPLQVRYSYQSASEKYEIERELRNGAKLRTKDRFKLRFTAQQKGSVYILHWSANGEVNELMEMSGFGNAVTAGSTYELPGEGRSFYLDETTGAETVYAMAFAKPHPALQSRYHALRNANDKALRQGFKAFLKGMPTENVNVLHFKHLMEDKNVITFFDAYRSDTGFISFAAACGQGRAGGGKRGLSGAMVPEQPGERRQRDQECSAGPS